MVPKGCQGVGANSASASASAGAGAGAHAGNQSNAIDPVVALRAE